MHSLHQVLVLTGHCSRARGHAQRVFAVTVMQAMVVVGIQILTAIFLLNNDAHRVAFLYFKSLISAKPPLRLRFQPPAFGFQTATHCPAASITDFRSSHRHASATFAWR
ncbi:hypothetical protein KCP73_00905 [Salmonella enterica subsp. enterica]|nr:hypothetical protein KCP73_00905 [Salmonella enterica subsp. enterica]